MIYTRVSFIEFREIASAFAMDEQVTLELTEEQYACLKQRQEALRKTVDDYLNKMAREPDGRKRRSLRQSLLAHEKSLRTVTEVIIRARW